MNLAEIIGWKLPCLHFDEFVNLLAERYYPGSSYRPGDLHTMPQDIACPRFGKGTREWRGNVSKLGEALSDGLLTPFGLSSQIPVTHTHGTPRGDWTPAPESLRRLCEITKQEYVALGMQRPDFCS